MLVNALTPSVDTYHLMWSEEQSRNLGLLTVILCIIFMNGNAISESKHLCVLVHQQLM